MTLFDLAVKNIRRNLKNYGLYIGATVLSILIYFTFMTLRYSENLQALAETSARISSLLNASAFVLLIFVALFIFYSNSFFMKKRKREVALYSLLGVRKRSIGWMLFLENMVIGLLSFLIGVGFGFLISQLMLALLMKLMGIEDMITFVFSPQAVVHTFLVFLVIFFITSLLGYRVIYRFSLIELFQADKKGEALPQARIFSTLIGVVSLAGAYGLALQDFSSEAWRILGMAMPLVIIGLAVLGSYFLFSSVLVTVFHFLKNHKRWAWKGLHVLTVSQLLHRIKGNARTLTIIATLSATTITAGGAVFALYYHADKEVQTYTPFTFMWEGKNQEIDDAIVAYAETIRSKSIRVEQDPFDIEYALLNYSTFSQLAAQLGWDEVSPPDAGHVLLIDAFYDERLTAKVESIVWNDQTFTVSTLYTEPVLNVGTLGGKMLILPDFQYDAIDAEEKVYQVVQVQNYKSQLPLSQELATQTEHFSSAVQLYKDSIEASGSMLFVGSFLGLVFLAATGSVVYFKTMTEAEEDKEKYRVLHMIGVTKKEMNRTIRQQVGMIFLSPLTMGLLHGSVALVAFSRLLQMNLLVPVLWWMLAYTFIYTLYYVMTIRSFKRTVLAPSDR